MNELKQICKDALTEKKARFIIGYSEDKNKRVKPFIARTPKMLKNLSSIIMLLIILRFIFPVLRIIPMVK